MRRGLTVLAVIPARGGSKGIPRKNMMKLAGTTLVGHAAQVALSISWLDHIVLSTDDEELASEGVAQGLEIIHRPAALATDEASSVDVWRHAWLASEGARGEEFELGVLLQPTSPLRSADDVTASVDLLIEAERDSVISVSPTPSHFAPEKLIILDPEGGAGAYLGEGFIATRQAIPDYFFLNGYCYAARRRRIVEERRILGPNVGAHVIDRQVVNIDDPFDLDLAEWLLTGRMIDGAEPGRPTRARGE